MKRTAKVQGAVSTSCPPRKYFIRRGGLRQFRTVAGKNGVELRPKVSRKAPAVRARLLNVATTYSEGDELVDGTVLELDDTAPMEIVIVADDPDTGVIVAEIEPVSDGSSVDYEIEVDMSELECFEEFYDDGSTQDSTSWHFGDGDTTIGIEG